MEPSAPLVRRGRGRLQRLAALGALGCGMAAAVEIVAHRGASFDAPENTLPAVLLGWERGADAVEIDIHQTADGRIVAIHDRDAKRVSGQSLVVAEEPLSRLRALDVGTWKAPRWQGTRIPTLEEVLDTVPAGRTLVIEVKCPRSVLPELERVLSQSDKASRVMLIAFDFPTIAEAKQRMPGRPCYWLYGFSKHEAERYGVRAPADLLERVRQAGLDGLDVRHDGPWVEHLTRSLRAAGNALYVYTVNDPRAARHLRRIGVTGITTDRPGFLRDALGRD